MTVAVKAVEVVIIVAFLVVVAVLVIVWAVAVVEVVIVVIVIAVCVNVCTPVVIVIVVVKAVVSVSVAVTVASLMISGEVTFFFCVSSSSDLPGEPQPDRRGSLLPPQTDSGSLHPHPPLILGARHLHALRGLRLQDVR